MCIHVLTAPPSSPSPLPSPSRRACLFKAAPRGQPVNDMRRGPSAQRSLIMAVVFGALVTCFLGPPVATWMSGAWLAGATYFVPTAVQARQWQLAASGVDDRWTAESLFSGVAARLANVHVPPCPPVL